MTQTISVAKAKSHFSEILAKVKFTKKKIIITKRNKPIAAIVDLDYLNKLDKKNKKIGLISVVGNWKESELIIKDINKIYNSRNMDKGRNVSL